MARRGIRAPSQVASLAYGFPGGTDVTGAMERSRVGDFQGRAAHRHGSVDTGYPGALAASIGRPAGRGDEPVRSRDLRSRQGNRQWVTGPPPATGRASPWWKSKWWHIA